MLENVCLAKEEAVSCFSSSRLETQKVAFIDTFGHFRL